jgi:hypothetical protein
LFTIKVIAGKQKPIRVKVIGSSIDTLKKVQKAAAQSEITAPNQQKLTRRPLRWKLVTVLNGVTSSALPYGFHKIEPLAGLPNIERATKILHKLASDPGVVAVMKSHSFSITCLTELYPRGKVGQSASCLMGLNVNKGEKNLSSHSDR